MNESMEMNKRRFSVILLREWINQFQFGSQPQKIHTSIMRLSGVRAPFLISLTVDIRVIWCYSYNSMNDFSKWPEYFYGSNINIKQANEFPCVSVFSPRWFIFISAEIKGKWRVVQRRNPNKKSHRPSGLYGFQMVGSFICCWHIFQFWFFVEINFHASSFFSFLKRKNRFESWIYANWLRMKYNQHWGFPFRNEIFNGCWNKWNEWQI